MNAQTRKQLGFWSIVLFGINGVIGSGIFLLPGKAMDLMGPGSIFVYLFVAVVVMTIALCFAECAGRFSRNGAAYVYAREGFGSFIGFEVGIMSWAIRIIAWSAMAVAFVTALAAIWPPARPGSLESGGSCRHCRRDRRATRRQQESGDHIDRRTRRARPWRSVLRYYGRPMERHRNQ